MALCPFAKWMPVVNHGGPVKAHLGLVIHVQEGDGSTFGQDDTAATEVSNTFWVGLDGTLEQMVDTSLMAWTEEAGNGYYASVETEGFATDPLTTEQVRTLGSLYAWGSLTHGWPMRTCDHGDAGMTTHAHYPSGIPDPSWGGHPCPGPIRAAQLPSILAVAVTMTGHPATPAALAPTPAAAPSSLKESGPMVPFLAICSATCKAEPAELAPPATGYPSVAQGSVWIVYPAGYRSWVGSAHDTEELLIEFGQTAPTELTGRTLARIAVRATYVA